MPDMRPNYPIAAVPANTAPAPSSPWVLPGRYKVTLTANGQTTTQTLEVRMDPRVKTTPADWQAQAILSKKLYEQGLAASNAMQQLQSVRSQLNRMQQGGNPPPVVADTLQKVTALVGQEQGFGGGGGGRGGAARPDTVTSIRGSLLALLNSVQQADAAPTSQEIEAAGEVLKQFEAMTPKLNEFKQSLPAVNAQLKQAGLPELSLTAGPAPTEENP